MAKTKTFISVIPFQPAGKLNSTVYKPCGNSKLAYGETRFPIIPVMSGYAESGDKARVIAIITAGENFKHNYETYFVPEIDAIVKAKGLEFNGIEVITTADSEDIDTQLRLFGDIIDKIGDNEEIYACITYGTKPTPIIETMALNYAYRLKKDISIGCIVYGRYLHGDANYNGMIYDTTALFFMDSIVNKLAEMKAPHPETAIKAMLGLDKNDHDE
ncbi:hypothetical protein FACS1894187_13610 [Synergistales bacterium]|nr:hypothetical protein FACS1894187_13610 [Synergistales bacterium]